MRILFILLVPTAVYGTQLQGAEPQHALHLFERQQLTDVYYSEGIAAGDLNADGQADIVYGPYWFAGPDFATKKELYEPVPQDRNRYADNFFSWIYDFNRDGWNDILVVGFPGTPAYVYENPTAAGLDSHWPKHQIFDWVSNESPQFVDIYGDSHPELVCTRDGFFGFATFDPSAPFAAWDFHAVSEQVAAKRFGHGLGIGDINGDDRMDILHAKGWFEQPESGATEGRWLPHQVVFSEAYGGAEMYAYDVDGDGDNDVITSQAAHDFGLSWYEQVSADGKIDFRHHAIMGSHPSENRYGVVFSELHSVALADIDGDGLKDIVTGKTYWSHHRQSPMWDAGAVVYWFKLVRDGESVDWIPYQADGESGIGRQLTVHDINADGLPDIVAGGMKGAHVLTHKRKEVTREEWRAAQPDRYTGPKLPSLDDAAALRGPKPELDPETGHVSGAIEAETLEHETTGGSARVQDMSRFADDRWSGDAQLWWTGATIGDQLKLTLPSVSGEIELEIVLSCAADYGVVQLSLDGKPLGDPVDLYSPNVVTSGVLSFRDLTVKSASPVLEIQMAGANRRAKKAFMCGIDYVRLRRAGDGFITPN